LGAVLACLTAFSVGTSGGADAILVYSFEKGREGMKMTLERASWARKKHE
jgi:hypothetical protein